MKLLQWQRVAGIDIIRFVNAPVMRMFGGWTSPATAIAIRATSSSESISWKAELILVVVAVEERGVSLWCLPSATPNFLSMINSVC